MGEITHFGGLPPASGHPDALLGNLASPQFLNKGVAAARKISIEVSGFSREQLLRVRIEVAEGVRGQRIPRCRESARPRAPAQRTVIAHSAAESGVNV